MKIKSKNQNFELSKVICKCTYLWERKSTGETIINGYPLIILNKAASMIWDLIDENNSIESIIDIGVQKGLNKESIIETIEDMFESELISYESSIWENN